MSNVDDLANGSENTRSESKAAILQLNRRFGSSYFDA
jgi:hypothetical protein